MDWFYLGYILYFDVIINIAMGINQSGTSDISNEQLYKKLTYVLTEHSENFSEIEVYRLNEKPYDYFIRYRQTAVDSPETRNVIDQKRELYRALENTRCIVKVEVSQVKKVIDLCSNVIEYDSYARYHNYTLENAIECKLARNKHFRQADFFYIMINLLTVGNKIQTILGKGYHGQFKSNKVYLSTEGYLKVYPFHLLSLNRVGSQFNEERSSNQSTINQVEINLTPKKSGQPERCRSYRDDLYDLAMLILQMILLSKMEEFNSPRKEQIEFHLSKGLDKRISPRLRALLLDIVSNRQNHSYESVLIELNQIKDVQNVRPSYCIRLDEDISLKQSQILKRQQQQLANQKEQKLKRLSSIHKNLVPNRIELMYKRNTLDTNDH